MAKSKPIPVRLPEILRNLLIDYAAFLGISRSEAIREVIKFGLMKKSYIGLLKRWKEKIRGRNPMVHMEKCDKCGSQEKLKIHHIDRNLLNFDTENLAILCEDCVRKLNKSILSFNPTEKFAAWFFYEES